MFIQRDGGPHFPVHHVHMTKKPTKQPESLTTTHLRAWREFRELTLEEVAPKFKKTHGQLSKIERGKSPYNQRLLEKAAELYGCTVLDLLTRDPDEAVELFSAYSGLDDDGKRRAARLVDALKSNR
ncbi:MAG: helix-turn-helix transcriptional regulator [Rhizobiales bacterium]|nr:helix-turn-helix transcriptional regulator [Hyphomicrobiales bacterium]